MEEVNLSIEYGKIRYNYRVLTERDMENSATLSQQKRNCTFRHDQSNTKIS